jgi:hypothetical protein
MQETIAYAVVEDIALSWPDYRPEEGCPPGLLMRVAGPTDEGVRAIEIWDSEAAWRRSHDRGGVATTTSTASSRRELHVASISAPSTPISKEKR